MTVDLMPVGGAQTIDQNITHLYKAGFPESVVNRMSGPSPEATQDRTQRTHIQPEDRE